MQFLIRIFLIFQILSFGASAQPQKTPEAIQFLLKTEKNIPVISGWFNGIIPKEVLPAELGKQLQYFIKTKDRLLCGINGTGMLYHVIDSAGFLRLNRIDETFYVGDRFWSSNFTYRNKMYSLAGYGFWKANGLLRQFNELSKDWNIIKLNEEHASSSGFNFWLDTAKGKLYLKPERNEEGFEKKSLPENSDTSMLYTLHLETGKWEPIGTLPGRIKSTVNTQWGMLNFGPYVAFLYDLHNNTILFGKQRLIDKLKKVLPGLENNIHFCVDSTLYFTDPSFTRLDSISLSKSDFENRNIKMYAPLKTTTASYFSFNLWWSIPILLCGATVAWMARRRRKFMAPRNTSSTPVPVNPSEPRENVLLVSDLKQVFTHNEQSLLQFIINKTDSGGVVHTEDINHFLGLADKKESIQKKNRNDVINSINQKWSAIVKENTQLILRKRTEFDKRSYYYTIKAEELEKTRSIFG